MYLVNIFVKERVLIILLPFLGLLLFETSVANQQQSLSNFTVIRTPGSSDSFTFTVKKFGNTKCLLKNPKICATYGGFKRKTMCPTENPMCCEVCQCVKQRPTFLVHEQRCVDDSNITEGAGLSKSGYRFNFDFPNSTCQSQALPTLNTTAPGVRNFSICSASFSDTILRCTMSLRDSKYLDHNGDWVELDLAKKRAVEDGFSVGVLQLKWKGKMDTILHGSIMMLDVTCFEEYFSISMGVTEIPIRSRLLFKMARSQVWQDSNVFHKPDTANPMNRSNGLVVIPTSTTVSIATTVFIDPSTEHESKEKLNVIHVPGKVDMILVVVAAVLGTLLFVAVIFACLGVAFLVMRKRKKVPLGASNPLYERGPDRTLAENRASRQTTLHNSHFYQPLVENTREVPGTQGEPIYQSLDEHVRVSKPSFDGYEENENRCSLSHCEMTADGYLIPNDGHTVPEPPISPTSREGDTTEDSYIDVLPDKENTETDKSLNYKYDKPEEIISEHGSTISSRQLQNEIDSDHETSYDDVKFVAQQPDQTKNLVSNKLEESDEKKSGKEKMLCLECKGTIGNYGTGKNSKPLRCLCDVTTKL